MNPHVAWLGYVCPFLNKGTIIFENLNPIVFPVAYNDPTVFKRFVVGIDRAKMRLYDCEQSAQEDIVDSGQEEEYNFKEKPKKSFKDFKFDQS